MFASRRRGGSAAALRVFSASFVSAADDARLASSGNGSSMAGLVSADGATVLLSDIQVVLPRGSDSASSKRERV